MSGEKLTNFIEALVSLIQAISWPLVVLVIVNYFGDSIKRILHNVSELSVKAGPSGVEATIKRKIEAAALLGAASAQKKESQSPSQKNMSAEDEAHEIADAVDRASHPRVAQQVANKWVLWVDDRLDENIYEKKSLETVGIQFTVCRSTEEAIEKLQLHQYNLTISDLERPPDTQAGYTLLKKLRERGFYTPYIIYDRVILPEHKAEARRLGARGTTNNPQELFDLAIACLASDVSV